MIAGGVSWQVLECQHKLMIPDIRRRNSCRFTCWHRSLPVLWSFPCSWFSSRVRTKRVQHSMGWMSLIDSIGLILYLISITLIDFDRMATLLCTWHSTAAIMACAANCSRSFPGNRSGLRNLGVKTRPYTWLLEKRTWTCSDCLLIMEAVWTSKMWVFIHWPQFDHSLGQVGIAKIPPEKKRHTPLYPP